MKHFGLLGERLSHSISPQIHHYIYKKLNIDGDYRLIEFPADKLKSIVEDLTKNNISGVNVTIPYKKDILPMLDKIDFLAKTIGSVNTVDINQKLLIGYNTDYYGIKASLEEYMPLESYTYLILGYGGASLPLIKYLIDENASSIYIASRNPQKSKKNLESIIGQETVKNTIKFIDYDKLDQVRGKIIFNTTPLGMFPHQEESAVEHDTFKNFDIAIDLIYNPCETKFLRYARRSGLLCQNGLKMLVYQAIKAVEIWNKINIDNKISSDIYRHFIRVNVKENSYSYSLKNSVNSLEPIYLVGMPGSGKTGLGDLLSHIIGLDFIDLDKYIENMTGKTIKYIFDKESEVSFREYEEYALRKISKLRNIVISTGGGSIINKNNRRILKESKNVFYIIRDCQTIINTSSLEDRPLLNKDPSKLFKIYEDRKSYYEEVANYLVHNKSSLETALFDMVDKLLDNNIIIKEGEDIYEK